MLKMNVFQSCTPPTQPKKPSDTFIISMLKCGVITHTRARSPLELRVTFCGCACDLIMAASSRTFCVCVCVEVRMIPQRSARHTANANNNHTSAAALHAIVHLMSAAVVRACVKHKG